MLPNASIEFVIDIFKKIGPRYVIVQRENKLHGLITKKDILVALNNTEKIGFPYEPVEIIDHDVDDGDSYNGTQTELSWSRRIRKWKVLSELSTQ